jgi:hypothetical protein
MTLPEHDVSLQDQALNLLRNIACADSVDIEMVVRGIGEERLFWLLEDKLKSKREETVLQVRTSDGQPQRCVLINELYRLLTLS